MNIIINQILIMGLIMLVGYILRKQGYFNEEVTEGLSKFSLRIIVPLTIIEAFIQPFSMQLLKEMFTIGLITVIFTFITIFVCNILYKDNRGVEKFATVFTNRGFIGIPIVRALFGSEAISLLTPIIFIGHVFMWTYGINLMSEDKKRLDLKTVFLNPNSIGLWIGLFIFIMPITLPNFVVSSIDSLTAINTPIAMIILGVYLANENIKQVFTNKMGYYVAIVRLIIIPLICLIFIKFMPIDLMAKQIFVISMAVPSAANTAMFSQLTGQNPSYGAQLVSLNTVLSALSLPLIMYLMQIIL